jgi:hypothetical protein
LYGCVYIYAKDRNPNSSTMLCLEFDAEKRQNEPLPHTPYYDRATRPPFIRRYSEFTTSETGQQSGASSADGRSTAVGVRLTFIRSLANKLELGWESLDYMQLESMLKNKCIARHHHQLTEQQQIRKQKHLAANTDSANDEPSRKSRLILGDWSGESLALPGSAASQQSYNSSIPSISDTASDAAASSLSSSSARDEIALLKEQVRSLQCDLLVSETARRRQGDLLESLRKDKYARCRLVKLKDRKIAMLNEKLAHSDHKLKDYRIDRLRNDFDTWDGSWSWLSCDGTVELAVRRNLSNISQLDLGYVIRDDVSRWTVSKAEIHTAAALLANTWLFFQRLLQELQQAGSTSAASADSPSSSFSISICATRQDATNKGKKVALMELDSAYITDVTPAEAHTISWADFTKIRRVSDVLQIEDETAEGTVGFTKKAL